MQTLLLLAIAHHRLVVRLGDCCCLSAVRSKTRVALCDGLLISLLSVLAQAKVDQAQH